MYRPEHNLRLSPSLIRSPSNPSLPLGSSQPVSMALAYEAKSLVHYDHVWVPVDCTIAHRNLLS